jgi:superfamily II DNA helicase RecQ
MTVLQVNDGMLQTQLHRDMAHSGGWGNQIVACAATATAKTATEIEGCLQLHATVHIRMPIAKPNVHIAMTRMGKGRRALERLVRVFRLSSAEQAIVFYCERMECERVAACLRQNSLDAEAYHAGVENRSGVEARARAGVKVRNVRVPEGNKLPRTAVNYALRYR